MPASTPPTIAPISTDGTDGDDLVDEEVVTGVTFRGYILATLLIGNALPGRTSNMGRMKIQLQGKDIIRTTETAVADGAAEL